jgi:hypothetical protein
VTTKPNTAVVVSAAANVALPTLVITDLDAQVKTVTPATQTSPQRTTYVAAQPKLAST